MSRLLVRNVPDTVKSPCDVEICPLVLKGTCDTVLSFYVSRYDLLTFSTLPTVPQVRTLFRSIRGSAVCPHGVFMCVT
jgi:hypothetical protein